MLVFICCYRLCGGNGYPAAVLPLINVIRVLLLFVRSAPSGTAGFEEPNRGEGRPPFFVWFLLSVDTDSSRFNIQFNCPGKNTNLPSPSSLSLRFLANPLLLRSCFNVSNQMFRLLYVVYTAHQCSNKELPVTTVTSPEKERFSFLYNLS